jgi:hypothetical protein
LWGGTETGWGQKLQDYADDNLIGQNMNNIHTKTTTLLAAGKEADLEESSARSKWPIYKYFVNRT